MYDGAYAHRLEIPATHIQEREPRPTVYPGCATYVQRTFGSKESKRLIDSDTRMLARESTTIF